MGLRFSLQQLYETTRLRDLAAEIGRRMLPAEQGVAVEPFALVGEEVRSRLPEDAVDAFPMASLQLGMLYHMELDPELRPYHNVDSGLFRATMVQGPFLAAVQRVVDCHPVLRTGFDLKSYGEPLQVVLRTAAMEVVWEDLRELDEAEQEAHLAAFTAREKRRLFELMRPPMLRYSIHLLAGDVFRLTMTENHVALDGWSFNAILAEVFGTYFRLLAGERIEAERPAASLYGAFVRLEQLAVGSTASRSFWRDQLAACPRLLVGGGGEPSGGEEEVAPVFQQVELVVPPAEAAAFGRWARQWMVPLKTVFLAVHVKVLSLLAGAEEIVTGLVTNGRPEIAGGSDTYGLFLNTVPFRLRVPAAEGWAELARRVFEVERQILPHRRVPMGTIQADYGQQALYEVLFNYVSFHSLRVILEREDFAYLGDVHSSSPTHYPLEASFNVNPVNGEILLILYSGSRALSRRRLEAVAELYLEALRSLAAGRALAAAAVPSGVLDWVPPAGFGRPHRSRPPEESAAEDPLPEAPPVARRAAGGFAPLSSFQESLWPSLDHPRPESPEPHLARVVRLRGELDASALAFALRRLETRHESLRTTFRRADAGPPLQAIGPSRATYLLAVIDLTGLGSAAAGERLVPGLAAEEEVRPFDLARGPLYRVVLVHLSSGEHALLLTLHPLIADSRSLEIWLSELSALYLAGRERQPVELTPLAVGYADFAIWQRERLSGEVLSRLTAWWSEHLAGAPPALELPLDRPRPKQRSGRGAAREGLTGDAALMVGLSALGRRHGATMQMTLLAAFGLLLHRYTGQPDLVVGLPIDTRSRPEVEGVIGLFSNLLALRVELSGNPPAFELLERVRAAVLAAFRHQELPFRMLEAALRPRRDLGRELRFEVQSVPAPAATGMESDGLHFAPWSVGRGAAPRDLTLSLDLAEELTGRVEYDPDLFDATTIGRFAGHFTSLLAALAAHPGKRLSEVSLLSPREEQALLVEWNDTAASDTAAGDLGPLAHQLFAARAAATPEAVAARCEGCELTYGELHHRANRMARRLRRLGIGADEVVGLLAERGLDFLTAVLAIWQAGGAYLPLDHGHPAERLRRILAQSGTRLLLVDSAAASGLDALGKDAPRWQSLAGLLAPAAAAESGGLPAQAVPANLAYVIYTSGSTGVPKGAMIEHRGLRNHLLAKIEGLALGADDSVAQTAPHTFDVSVWQLLAPLLAGGKVHIFPDAIAHDPARLLSEVARHGISILETVPSLLALMLADAARAEGDELPPLDRLRWLVPTGEALPPELCRRWLAAYPNVPLMNAYGPTECSDDVSHQELRHPPGELPRVSIGRPLRNLRLYVLTPELRPAPLGVPGELCVGGIAVGRGYLRDTARTAEVFVPDPFARTPGERLYRTRDLARHRPDGSLEVLGRIDYQVKLHGLRIELGEIESALRSHPGVSDAAVLLRTAGARGPELVAYFVAMAAAPDAGAPEVPELPEITAEALRGFLSKVLPDSMVPLAWVALPRLPLTESGKLDRAALPAPAVPWTTGGEGLRTVHEELLVGIWSGLLELPEVGIHDSFFALGGQSLLAMRLVSRLREAFRVELPLRVLFEKPTIAELAAHLELAAAQGAAEAPPIVRRPPGAPAPLSFEQERLWFLARFQPESAEYNIPSASRLHGDLDAPALVTALRQLEVRHESLRTSFAEVDGEPVQVIAPPRPTGPLVLVDLSGGPNGLAVPSVPAEAEMRRLAALEAARPFDLRRGPLYRVVLLRLSTIEHVLLLTIHHVISDDWSEEIWWRELSAFYAAARQRQPLELSSLPVQYTDYAAWQRERLAGAELSQQMAWWREQLAGAPHALELPTDRPRSKVRRGQGGSWQGLASPPALAQGLTALARRSNATWFMTLLAAFELLLHRYTGQPDMVVGTPIANRGRRETEGVIGFFLNTLALRVDLAGNPRVGEFVERVRGTLLAAYQHQDLPFGKLVAELQPVRDLGRTPLFQVMFVFVDAAEGNALPGLASERLYPAPGPAKFDLTLALERRRSVELAGGIEYDRELFDSATIGRFGEHFAAMLKDFVAHPSKRLTEVSLLRPFEVAQLVEEWNPKAQASSGLTLERRFAAQVERTPDALAVAAGGLQLTYRGLDVQADRLRQELARRGIGANVAVGLLLERSVAAAVGVLAVLKAGGVCIPLDPAYPTERLRFMLADSAAPVVLTHERMTGRLRELAGNGVTLLAIDGGAALGGATGVPPPPAAVSPQQRLYVIYTSGSTGRPKGIELPQRVMSDLVDVLLGQCRPRARTLQLAPLSFDASFTEMFTAWLSGGSIHVAAEEVRRDAARLARLLEEESIETVIFPVALLHQVAEEIVGGHASPLSLRDVISTGEQLVITEAVRRLFADPRFATCRLHNHYGPSETHVVTALTLPAEPRLWEDRPVIGRPIANARAYVVDLDLRLQPLGVHGELLLGGTALAQSYLGRPDLTAERFLPDPWSGGTGDRVYRTGDLARWRPDGVLQYLGRIDHQVKLRGFRVEPAEIESVLRAHPAVGEAVVVLRTSAVRGLQLVAYILPTANGPAPDAAELRRFLAARLPDYMVPSAWVGLARLPINPNGKLDRAALPVPAEPEAGSGAAPRTVHEELLAGIWSALLGVPTVGSHDDFFALGGHSLLAMRLASRVRDAFRQELPLRVLFEKPTLAALAAHLEAAEEEGSIPVPPIVRRATAGAAPLSFAQERLWFLASFQPESAEYNVASAVRLHGDLDPGALAGALRQLEARHESLRTSFAAVDGEPVQVIAPTRERGQLAVVDLAGLASAASRPSATSDLERLVLRLAERETTRPFDLGRDPLYRVVLLRLGPGEHALLFTIHHILADDWSLDIWTRELAAFYAAIRERQPPPFAPLPVQYADYAVWQRQWLAGEVAGAADGVVAAASGGGAAQSRAAHGPTASKGARRAWRHLGRVVVPARVGAGGQRAVAAAGGDAVHDLAGLLRCASPPLRRPAGSGGRDTDRQPRPAGDRRGDRVLPQHPGAARRPLR